MSRSFIFSYVFVILAVSYAGGILLFRELADGSLDKLLTLLDTRVIEGQAGSWLPHVLTTLCIVMAILLCAKFTYSRPVAFILAAMKCVLFGLSSAYLLANGLSFFAYAMWWFPFQLLGCVAILFFTFSLTPPFFMRRYGKVERNDRLLLFFIGTIACILFIENLLFYFVLP